LVFIHDLGECLDSKVAGLPPSDGKVDGGLKRNLSTNCIPKISSLAAPTDRYILHRRWARKVDEEEEG
jgi:hypothetical protein